MAIKISLVSQKVHVVNKIANAADIKEFIIPRRFGDNSAFIRWMKILPPSMK